jgi:hypothetical protein
MNKLPKKQMYVTSTKRVDISKTGTVLTHKQDHPTFNIVKS